MLGRKLGCQSVRSSVVSSSWLIRERITRRNIRMSGFGCKGKAHFDVQERCFLESYLPAFSSIKISDLSNPSFLQNLTWMVLVSSEHGAVSVSRWDVRSQNTRQRYLKPPTLMDEYNIHAMSATVLELIVWLSGSNLIISPVDVVELFLARIFLSEVFVNYLIISCDVASLPIFLRSFSLLRCLRLPTSSNSYPLATTY